MPAFRKKRAKNAAMPETAAQPETAAPESRDEALGVRVVDDSDERDADKTTELHAEGQDARRRQEPPRRPTAAERRAAVKAAKARAKREKKARRSKLRRLPTTSYPGTLVLRASKSSQDALGYELLCEDGTIKVEDGRYSRVIEFQDASFQAARVDEQREIYDMLSDLYSTFDDTVHIQVKILCRTLDEDEFRADMYLHDVAGDDKGNAVRHEINGIIDSKIAETQMFVSRRRLIVMTVEQPTMAKAVPQLARACEEAIRQLRNIGVEAHMLTGNELLLVIDSVTNPDDTRSCAPTFDDLKVTDGRGRTALALGYTTKDLVAPPDFTRIDDTHVSWGDCYGQALYVPKWASSVRSDMVSSLAELPINQVITLDVQCWEQTKAIETIEGMVTELKVQKSDYVLKHSQTMYITDEMLPTNLQDAMANTSALRDDLVSRDQKMWALTFTILTWADSIEACDANVDQIKDVFRRFTYRAEALVKLQGQGFAAALPTGRCDIPYVRNLTTAPLAALVPFTSVELSEPGGMYMGQNQTSKNFIFYDRKNAVSPNGFILGKPGRGKSVTAKTTIMWTLLTDPDADVIVLDPEREYINMAEEFDGEVVQIAGGSKTYINPFDLEIAQGEAPLAMKTDAIISMVEMMAKDLSELQKSLIDRAVSRVYDRYFETKDPADFPTLSDFYDMLRQQPEEEANILAVTIERFVNGQASIFNHKTNVNTSKRFVIYDIRDCADNMKSLALLILLDATWQRIVRNRERGVRTWVFIDEMQLLFENDYAIDYFDQLYTRSRKYGAIPTGITQNVERVVNNDKTRLMLANSDFLILLGQSSSDAAALGEVVKLSERQVATIRNAGPGEGLLVASGKVIAFTNVIPQDTHVYRMVTTKIDDLNAYRAEREAASGE